MCKEADKQGHPMQSRKHRCTATDESAGKCSLAEHSESSTEKPQ